MRLHKFLYVGAAFGRPFESKVTFIRNGPSKAPLPTVCMSITLFAVGADSISALLVFREHMECSPTVFGDIPSRDLPSQSLCDSSPKGRAFIYKDFNNKPLTLGEVTAVRQAERG